MKRRKIAFSALILCFACLVTFFSLAQASDSKSKNADARLNRVKIEAFC
ncbi:MAG: hypothetical protein IKT43_00960 [Clostridia bacterium]|nr:hypothetical protein [Clostridia bacterium]